MLNKFIVTLALVASLFFTGCDNSNGTSTYNPPAQPVQPVQPTPPPQPIEPPESGVPDVGTGSLYYTQSCESGFAKIVYIYQSDSTIDSNSFVILHSVDGKRKDITTGSVFSNGSISRMEEDIYIEANDGDKQLAHQIEVQFVSDGVNQTQSFSFIQPPCELPTEDDNTTVQMHVNVI